MVYQEGYKVPAKSVADIASIVKLTRESLGYKDTYKLDIPQILEHDLHNYGVEFFPVDDVSMGDSEGEAIPDNGTIMLSDSVYSKLCNEDGRARFTACHEIGHLALHSGVSFSRTTYGNIKPFEDSEWQANIFASLFLMPTHLVGDYIDSPSDIVDKFGVSYSAAKN